VFADLKVSLEMVRPRSEET